ncbi:MAG: arginine--tRNA ligase [Pseudomonadota bacterium]|jgi:arginyl-tRNA synthetase
MSTVAALLTDLVLQATRDAGYGEVVLAPEPAVPTADPRHGDWQSNHAFRVAKAMRANPRAVAEAVRAALPAHPAIAEATVAGPGFLNFSLAPAWIGEAVATLGADARLTTPAIGAGKTLVIDYSSPNIAKRMHVGHLRSTVIGAALDRLYRFVGYRVIADNHIGDWGTQFGKLIVGWHAWRDEEAYAADAIGELQRIYKRFGALAGEDPSLEDRARAETAKLQAGDPDNLALWRQFVDVSLREFDAVYRRLGVSFDVIHGESFYNDALAPLVARFLDAGWAIPSEGAVVVPFSEVDGAELAQAPLLIRKRDGASLYGTTDLATIAHRHATWAPDVYVYVTDTRQQLHFKQVFQAARRAGWDFDFRHVWFGMLRFEDGSIAATRGEGQSVNLVDVLDEAVRRARTVVDERSAELPEAERAGIAEAVGTGAVRYADLSQHPQTDIVFSWDKMLALQGNTAPYLMYAHARLASILRRAEVAPDAAWTPARVAHAAERTLALTLLRTPEVVVAAAQTHRPNLLADHLHRVASDVASFYTDCPVLHADVPPDVREARLTLVRAARAVLGKGLDLLGLVALDRM